MKLEQYLAAIGHHPRIFMDAGVPSTIMKTVERGEPIAEAYALKLCKYLSQEFERPITIRDIEDIKTC